MCVSGERRGGGGDIKIRFDLRAIQRIHSGFALLYARVCVFACAIQERALVTVTTLLRSGDILGEASQGGSKADLFGVERVDQAAGLG